MTLMQIQIVVNAARTGSVSAAAEILGISQPNASTAIRTIEKELGLKLFRRASKGIIPTEHCYRFLDHAAILLKEYDTLSSLRMERPLFRFRLGVQNYTPTIDAFIRLCADQDDSSVAELSYIRTSPMQGVTLLKEHRLDLFACVIPDSYQQTYERILAEYQLASFYIAPCTVNLKMRKDHPVLHSVAEPEFYSLLDALKQYPYVEYQSEPTLEEIQQFNLFPDLQYRYRISIDERETRFKIVANSNAFTLGSNSSQDTLDQFGLVQFSAQDIRASLLCLIREGEGSHWEYVQYMNYLREEMESYK